MRRPTLNECLTTDTMGGGVPSGAVSTRDTPLLRRAAMARGSKCFFNLEVLMGCSESFDRRSLKIVVGGCIPEPGNRHQLIGT